MVGWGFITKRKDFFTESSGGVNIGILRNIIDKLPTIRTQHTEYNDELLHNRYNTRRYNPQRLRYLALRNKDVQRCVQIYKNTALACGYTIDSETNENDNIPTTSYLKRVMEEPEGHNTTRTYADINSIIWKSLLILGDCFFEISTDNKYGILNGFKYIHNDAIMWNTENGCYQLREKPEVMYENYELVHMQRPSIVRKNSPWGVSVIDSCAQYIALIENALDYNNNILNNDGLDPHTIISYDKDMSPQAFKSETKRLNVLKRKQMKTGNTGGIIAVKGATVQKATTSNKDMNYLEMMKFARDNIIQAFGIPPQIAGIIETANLGAGSGDSQRKDWKTTFEGESTIIENAFNKAFKFHGFTERFHYGKVDIIDELYDAQVNQILVGSGILTRDEVRNNMGLDKLSNNGWAGYYR